MITRILAGVCLAMLIASLLLWWRMDVATERAATAEHAAHLATETADAWRLALDQQTAHQQATDRLLADERRARADLRTTTDKRIRAYEDALRADQGAYAWDLAAVPAAVAERMCEYRSDHPPGGSALPEASGGAAAADTGPACRPSNGHLWRWAERLVDGLESCNQDKAGVSRWAHL